MFLTECRKHLFLVAGHRGVCYNTLVTQKQCTGYPPVQTLLKSEVFAGGERNNVKAIDSLL